MGIATSAAATLVLYYISYRRHSARIVEGPGRSGRRADSNGREIPFLTMPQFGFLSFAWKTLTRSRQHKMFLGLYAGIGCAVVIDAFIGITTARSFGGLGILTPELVQATLSVPLVMAFCLVSGMRYVYGLPSELRANWLFKLTEDDRRAKLLDTVELTYLAAVAPVLLLTFPSEAWILGAGRAVTHLIVSALLCLILIEAALLNLRKLPFVCSYLPGKVNPSQLIVIYWLAFSTFVFTMTGLEAWCFRDPPRVLVLAGLLMMAWPLARRLRLADWGLTPLMYDDALEPEVYLLGIER